MSHALDIRKVIARVKEIDATNPQKKLKMRNVMETGSLGNSSQTRHTIPSENVISLTSEVNNNNDTKTITADRALL